MAIHKKLTKVMMYKLFFITKREPMKWIVKGKAQLIEREKQWYYKITKVYFGVIQYLKKVTINSFLISTYQLEWIRFRTIVSISFYGKKAKMMMMPLSFMENLIFLWLNCSGPMLKVAI